MSRAPAQRFQHISDSALARHMFNSGKTFTISVYPEGFSAGAAREGKGGKPHPNHRTPDRLYRITIRPKQK